MKRDQHRERAPAGRPRGNARRARSGPLSSVVALAAAGALSLSVPQGLRAAPPLPPGTLPVPGANFITSGQASVAVSGAQMTVNQASQRAILNWTSFDIARDAGVHFNHMQGASAATLNRIWDANPSVIQGRLTGVGQVYLINRNGIIFDGTAQVNVGSLIASTLNITDERFNQGLLSLGDRQASAPVFEFGGTAETFGRSLVRIEPGAQITAASGGRVFVFAPRIENAGTITSPSGQIVLAAGAKVYLASSGDPALRGLLVEVDPFTGSDANGAAVNLPGSVVNERVGQLVAQRGNVSLAALAVNQNGRVSATTSVTENGSVLLLARDTNVPYNPPGTSGTGSQLPAGSRYGRLTFGPGSITEVTPELDNAATTTREQAFTPSSVQAFGRQIVLEEGARIAAEGGRITLSAQATLNPAQPAFDYDDPASRIYVAAGAVIDASGTTGTRIPAEANLVEVELRGAELADSPLQRNGFLRGQTVKVDARVGTPLANVSGAVAQQQIGVGERSAAGGSVTLRSAGDIVLRAGSTVDVSGGTVEQLAGRISTSKLLTQFNQIVDIGDARADQVYVGFADVFEQSFRKWGVDQTFTASQGRFSPGYVEGRGAGSLQILARSAVLDGTLAGGAFPGPTQRTSADVQGGQLVIGTSVNQLLNTANVTIAATGAARLPAGFAADDALPADVRETVIVDAAVLGPDRFTRAAISANGAVTLAPGADLSLGARGSLALTGRSIDIGSSVRAPGGAVSADTRNPLGQVVSTDPGTYRIALAEGAALDVRGTWTNDRALVTGGGVQAGRVAPRGGSIRIGSFSDVTLGRASVLDASGGGWVKADGSFEAGDAGTIAIASGRHVAPDGAPKTSTITLGGDLRAEAIGKGGTLSLDTGRIAVGTAAAPAGTLVIDPGFITRGGFTDVTLAGDGGVAVQPGVRLDALAASRTRTAASRNTATGATLDAVSVRQDPLVTAQEFRRPVTVRFAAGNKSEGDLLVGEGAAVITDPGGVIAMQAGGRITVEGALSAPGGAISLVLDPRGDQDGFRPDQSIWLGPQARLDTAGAFVARADPRGVRRGDVFGGGTVTLDANSGYVVMRPGSLVDVSGTGAILDLADASGNLAPTPIASAAGSVTVASGAGMLLGGTWLGRPGGPGAAGGTLTFTLEPASPLAAPTGPRSLVVAAGPAPQPATLRPGDIIDTGAFNGRAVVPADAASAGGFARIDLSSVDEIRFDGAPRLAAAEAIRLDAPSLAANPGADARLASAYVSLGNTVTDVAQRPPAAAVSGDGKLSVSAALVDLEGTFSTQGLGQVAIVSTGDIRMKGVPLDTDGDANRLPDALRGALFTGASLDLSASQIYPTTASEFTLAVRDNAAGSIAFRANPAAGAPRPVLSAGGRLTAEAPAIIQSGVVKAPYGRIDLVAERTLTLAAGSLTSVSAEGQAIPFGRTELTGAEWVYDLGDANRIIASADPTRAASPPERAVVLRGGAVDFARGATVDVSGAGELRAYEFIPGPGGSVDVLAPGARPETFAILPGLVGAAPYDRQEYAGTTLRPGDSVVLSTPAAGLPAGTYQLLPARYALLPGAFLVRKAPGTTDLALGRAIPQLDGSTVVAGYRAVAAGDTVLSREARTAGFVVEPGAAARARSEYRETFASAAFPSASAQRPADAGRLSVDVRGGPVPPALVLEGSLLAAAGLGGRGAEVEIAAPRLAVTSPGGADFSADLPGDAVRVDARALSRLGAGSVLLGGQRGAGGRIDVRATDVVIANRADTGGDGALVAPEVAVVASGRILLKDGAEVRAQGASVPPRELRIGDAATDGDGALLYAGTAAGATVLRENVDGDRGALKVESGATIAGRSLILDSTGLGAGQGTVNQGGLDVGAGGGVALGAGRISIGETGNVREGLVLSNADVQRLASSGAVRLTSYSTVDLYGAAVVGGPGLGLIDIETGGFGGYANAGATARLAADRISLANRSGAAFSPAPAGRDGVVPVPGSGTLDIRARELTLGPGSLDSRGFGTVVLEGRERVTGTGDGGFRSAGAITVETPLVTGADGARLALAADGGALAIGPSAAPVTGGSAGLGARIDLAGDTVSVATRIASAGGLIDVRGARGVTLASGAVVEVTGAAEPVADSRIAIPGGSVRLAAASGDVSVDAGAVVDVSAQRGSGAAAGSVALEATAGALRLDGSLRGSADAPLAAGRFSADARTLDLSAVNRAAAAGGFTGAREFRARTGDIEVAQSDVVAARSVGIYADGGAVGVRGRIDARPDGGSPFAFGDVRIAARDDVTLHGTARIDAGSTGRGGNVSLASGAGSVAVRAGAAITVAGGSADRNGEVLVRAPRSGGDVAVTEIAGAIEGASSITVEAVRRYEDTLPLVGGVPTINAGVLSTLRDDTNAYMSQANVAAMRARLGRADDPAFQIRPGIDVVGSGDIALGAEWNLRAGTDWRYSDGASATRSQPGTLTIRARGDLRIDNSLTDAFGTGTAANTLQAGESWSYRLVGGADTAAANPLATRADAGSVTVAPGRLVRTGTGDIHVAAGRDVVLSGAGLYTAGRPGATFPSGDFLWIQPPAFPDGGGDVSIAAGRDVIGQTSGSLQVPSAWLRQQGRITDGVVAVNPGWGINYAGFRRGVGTLGGGNVSIAAGADVVGLGVVAASNGRLVGPRQQAPDPNGLFVQGGGDLAVTAGGDIVGGLFYTERGTGTLAATGGVVAGTEGNALGVRLGIGEGPMTVTARESVAIATVTNPLSLGTSGAAFTYGPGSALDVLAATGDVTVASDRAAWGGAQSQNAATYPGTVRMSAPRGAIDVLSQTVMAPTPLGQLELLAGGDITLPAIFAMSDQDPATIATVFNTGTAPSEIVVVESGARFHAPGILHRDDFEPVRIVSTGGDVVGRTEAPTLYLPKRALVLAARDVRNLGFFGQNVREGDITVVSAGRDVLFGTARGAAGNIEASNNRVELGGPGDLYVVAGRDVDLGASSGLITRGSINNPFLPDGGANVTVRTGGAGAPAYAAFSARHADAGIPPAEGAAGELAAHRALFAEILAAGRASEGGSRPEAYARGYAAIETLFPGEAGRYAGELKLFFSQIKTEGGGDINLVVPGGLVNAGLASVTGLQKSAAQLGIVTAGGGSIRSITDGDFLVNQSRVFTILGGDILLWSSNGNIDAGRGAKTASATPPPQVVIRGDQVTLDITNSIAGSGIGTLLGRPDVVPGSVDLFAPRGIIDAGDAGIRASGNLNVAAVRIVGADNIQVGGVSTGTPASATGSLAGATTGLSNAAADASRSAEQASQRAGPARDGAQDSRPTFISVEVIGTGESELEAERRRRGSR
jgi:filamentous hemagglutinin family protein